MLLCIVYTLLQVMALYPIVSFRFSFLLLKSFMDALAFAGIGVLLRVVVPSSNYVKLDPIQRIVNFFALGLVVVLVWVILFFLSSWLILGGPGFTEMRSLLPLAAFVGILLYVILLQAILHGMVDKEEELLEQPEGIDKQDTSSCDGKEQEEYPILERIAVKVGQKIHVILVADIIYIQSDGDYVQIITGQNRFLKEETMKSLEAGLPSTQFVRVHRSYIVNVEKILRIEMYEKQSQMLALSNGDRIKASASGYKALRSVLNL